MSASTAFADPQASAQWSVWTTTARVVVTEASELDQATVIVRDHLDRVDAPASRFRPDSEVCRLATAPAGTATVSPLLRDLVEAALWAARVSDGAVDPTLGTVLSNLGYAGDLDAAGACRRTAPRVTVSRRATWRDLHLDGDTLRLPPGTLLDLGATAKALAADECALLIHERLGCGALVSLGGDIRVAGPEPSAGWRVLVQDGADEPASTVRLTGAQAIATSSTLHRRWRQDGEVLHHVLDPLTGRPAEAVWRTASVAAATCLEANTWSTAALVRGRGARGLLDRAGVDARLVAADGTVRFIGGWPR